MSLDEIPFCDVFTPNKKEFKNFEKYVTQCVKKAKSGIIKIIPPRGWKARENYTDLNFNVSHPIEQVVNGSSGFYEALLIQKESRSLAKYKKLVIDYDKLTEGKTIKEVEQLVNYQLISFGKI
jgi:hypothetical protein